MPPPPPPPGPPLPPPPPPTGPLGGGARGGASNDKSQLLADIRKGTGLKKVVTNDRSAPVIDAKKQNGSGDTTRSNGAPQGLGGLFAGGMPKLKAAVPGRPGVQPMKPSNKMGNDAAESKSNTPGPQPKFTKNSELPAGYGTMRRPFSNEGKPLAPMPPHVGQVFNKSSVPDITNNNVNRPKPSPQLPMKPQSFNAPRIQIQQGTTTRSGGNLGSKPSPPPKSPGTNANVPPALPSKPPSLQRHQSMNENDLRNRRSFGPGGTAGMLGSRNSPSVTVSPAASMTAIPTAVNNAMDNSNRMGGPPPYGQHMRNGSSPHLSMHGKQNHAPPPPPNRTATSAPRPPPPPPPSRVGTQHSQSQPPPPPPHRTGPPPPPPAAHQLKQVALGGQTGHVTGQALPPPPPARNFSARNSACGGDDFESRFAHLFRSENEFPQPGPFIGHKKFYPSENAKNGQGQRNPPPPPPASSKNDNTQYQIGHKMFAHEATKC